MNKILNRLLGLSFLVAASSASAVMINDFSYTLTGGWLEDSAKCQNGSNCVSYGGATADIGAGKVYSNISWGTPHADGGMLQSSLTAWQNDAADILGIDKNPDVAGVKGDVTGQGQVLTDGTVRIGTSFQHDNITVKNDGNVLSHATFAEEFTITGTSPNVSGPITLLTTQLLFGVAFFETPNLSDPSRCHNAQQSATACDDFFVLFNEEDLLTTVNVCDNAECWDYTFNIFSEGLTNVKTSDLAANYGIFLTAEEFLKAGEFVGVLTTTESANNPFNFGFRVTHAAVPEPQPLALLGLGLLGLGLSRRNKAAKTQG